MGGGEDDSWRESQAPGRISREDGVPRAGPRPHLATAGQACPGARGPQRASGLHLERSGPSRPRVLLVLVLRVRVPRGAGLAILVASGARALAVLLLVLLPGRVAVRVVHAPAAAGRALRRKRK